MPEEMKYMSLATTYEIDETFDSDKFIKLRLRVCHDGTNPNGSTFGIDDINKAEETIKNVPILAYVIFDEDGKPQFRTHDMHIEEDKTNEGEYKIIYDEQPIGVVPETNNYKIEEYEGRNYVYVDCFIWRDYSNYAENIINRDKNINLSMEILVDSFKYDGKNKTYHITDYRYKGITLLGNNVGTGMLNAKATIESFSEESKQKFIEMVSELKLEIDMKFKEKEAENQLNEKLKLLEQYNLTEEQLDFNLEEISLEDLELKLKEFDKKVDYFATYNQKCEAIAKALNVFEKNYNDKYFYLMDFDDNFVFVCQYYWDDDNYERKYGRITYEFNNDEVSAVITGEFEELFLVWLTADEKQALDTLKTDNQNLQAEINTYKEEYKTKESDVELLREFKESKLKEERQAQENEMFNKFNKLDGVDEFEQLKQNASEYSIEDIEVKCFAILGKLSTNFSSVETEDKKMKKITVDRTSKKDSLYGGLFEKHGIKKEEK